MAEQNTVMLDQAIANSSKAILKDGRAALALWLSPECPISGWSEMFCSLGCYMITEFDDDTDEFQCSFETLECPRCGSFTRARRGRRREALLGAKAKRGGFPPPLRSKDFVKGLPGLTSKERSKVD